MLDYNINDIPDDIKANKKKRKEIIKRIEKEKRRNYSFRYLSKHTGKGKREQIWILHKKNNNNRIIQTYNHREDIENAIKEHN